MELPVNQRLRNHCDALGLKQYEVAYKTGTSTRTINDVWNMKGEPSCKALRGFAVAFPDLDMNFVFRGQESRMEDLVKKVTHLEALLAEKERYINLLEDTRKEANNG